MNPRRLILLFTAALVALAAGGGCDTYEPAGVERQYVVEAYLEAGRVLPPVRLSRTAPVNQPYDFNALAVSDAEVRVQRVDDGASARQARPVRYVEQPDSAGLYRPLLGGGLPPEAAVVQPLGRYRLTVAPPRGDGIDTDTIRAETTVPDTFRIVQTSGDTLAWRQDELQVTLSQSAYPNRGARYVVTTTALDVAPENLTPLAAEILGRSGEDDLDINDLSVTESPVINEGNYEVDAAGNITIDVPWLVANFYGRNEIALRALDDNYYDLVRSQRVQQGGSTFSPGEIPNVIERVAGGTGLFGSYAGVRYRLEVTRFDFGSGPAAATPPE